jgi:hypothetical protein
MGGALAARRSALFLNQQEGSWEHQLAFSRDTERTGGVEIKNLSVALFFSEETGHQARRHW